MFLVIMHIRSAPARSQNYLIECLWHTRSSGGWGSKRRAREPASCFSRFSFDISWIFVTSFTWDCFAPLFSAGLVFVSSFFFRGCWFSCDQDCKSSWVRTKSIFILHDEAYRTLLYTSAAWRILQDLHAFIFYLRRYHHLIKQTTAEWYATTNQK